MNIALCDDEKIFIDDLKHMLENISFQYNIDIYIDTFNCGEDLITYLNETQKSYDLIFLDILMGKTNGIDTSKKIRELDEIVQVVFLTSTAEFALLGYEVKALNYLIKPANFDKIKSIILNLLEIDKESVFSFKVNHTLYKIDLNDVNYFEVNNRVININATKNDFIKDINFYKKLDDLELELIDYNFARCHRSYLVNLKNIQSISAKEVIFLNGSTSPISRRLYKDIKLKFSNYLCTLVT